MNSTIFFFGTASLPHICKMIVGKFCDNDNSNNDDNNHDNTDESTNVYMYICVNVFLLYSEITVFSCPLIGCILVEYAWVLFEIHALLP